MKRIITIVCVVVLMLSLGVAAYAAINPKISQADSSQAEQIPADIPRTNGEKPSDPPDRIDFDEMVSKGVISQETCDKIKAYMEEHRPTDLPTMEGQAPQMDDQAPDMNSQPPQMDGQAPDMNSQSPQMDGQAPDMNGQPPQMDGQAPDMNSQPPQMDGQAPDMNCQLPQMNGAVPMGSGLLNDLLNNGIITQAEYDALSAAIAK